MKILMINSCRFVIAAKKIKLYKEIRHVVQKGTLYRIQSPFDTQRAVLQYVSPDKSKSIVFMYNMWDTLNQSTKTRKAYQNVRLKGLEADTIYKVSQFWGRSVSGQTLMNIGLPWLAYGDTNSKVIVLQKN